MSDYNEPEWHGFILGERSLSIGRLPGRAQAVLYLTEGGRIIPLAYFRSATKAGIALRFLDEAMLRKQDGTK